MRKEYTRTIYFILILLLILLGISLCLMYHAQFISSLFHKHFIKQCGWIILGIVVMMICYLIPSKIWFNYSLGIYLLNVVLLVLVLFMGKSANGAKAWLAIGNFQIQPSEFMKFSYSLFLASFCANRHFYHFREEWKFLLKVFLIFIIPTILVFLEPDTGAIIFFMLITFLLLWKTKISRGWFWIFFLIILMVGGAFFYCYFYQRDFLIQMIGTGFFYRVERLFNFGSGMQIENALIALGSAPLMAWNLKNTGIYIPEAPTDFAFDLASNVFGLVGPVIILFCYLGLNNLFLKLYKLEKEPMRKNFCLAFLGIFFFSQLENIGMNLGLLPIMGIPLPFLSYGGSAMIVNFAFLGIIFQNIKSFAKKSKTFRIDYR